MNSLTTRPLSSPSSRLIVCVTLINATLAGCDRVTPSAPRSPATQPTASAPVSPTLERPPPATMASTPPSKPSPASEDPVSKIRASAGAEPDIKKLPDRTQRLIRDTRKALADAPGSGDLPAKLGMIYLTNEMESESIPLFRQAIERVPSQAANWYYLGLALSAIRDSAGAIAAFQKAVSLDKKLLYAHLRLADLLLATDKDAALAEYQEVDKLGPTVADTLVRLARGYDQLGKSEEALAACHKAIELEPRCPLGHALLADLLTKKGDESGAQQQRKMAAANGTCSTPPDMLYIAARATGHPIRAGIMRAIALANMGNFDMAIKGLQNLSANDPMNLEIPLALGQVYQMQGDLTQAMNEYGQVLQSDPGHIQAATNRAAVQIAIGRTADAEKTLKTALAVHPDSPELLQSMSVVQARTNRVDDAIVTYRRAIDLKNGDPAFRLEFAKLLLGAKKYSEALKELEPLADTPLHAKALITRSAIKGGQGDTKGAEDDLKAAQADDPNDPEPFTSLAVLFATNKQYDRAIANLEDGLKRHPNDVAIMNALAWLLATAPQPSLRNGTRAVELSKKCCEKTSFSSHGYLDTLATALAEAGQFEDSVTACQQAKDKATRVGDRQAVSEYEMRLSLFKSNKPFRMAE